MEEMARGCLEVVYKSMSQLGNHKPNHRPLNKSDRMLLFFFKVLCQSSLITKPPKGPFYNPPLWYNLKSTYSSNFCNNFKQPTEAAQDEGKEFFAVKTLVSQDFGQAWKLQ